MVQHDNRVRPRALQNASPTCLNSRHLTSPVEFVGLSHSDRFVQSGQTVSKSPPPNVGKWMKRCISMYQCRRKWLKRNLRAMYPSMTRTQRVFCFSRTESCTDLAPGKRRKPSRNYKNWRLWRRLGIFWRWIPWRWICMARDWTEAMDWWVDKNMVILFAFTWLQWNSSGRFWWDLWAAKTGIF